MMHRYITIIALLAAVLTSCTARIQDPATVLADSAFDKFGGLYHPYIYAPGGTTAAPRGYKPFYVSHFGRHGSRYPVSQDYVMNAMSPLLECSEDGLLTAQGEKMLGGFRKLDSLCTGVYGVLCPLGGEEHKAIGRRMYLRTPSVFRQKDRDSVFVQSTHKQRCLMSSFNFCTTLSSYAPSLKMNLVAGEKYYDILTNAENPEIKAHNKVFNEQSDVYAAEHFSFDSLYVRLFTDPAAARKHIPNDRLIVESIWANGVVAKYLGVDEILDCLTSHEVETASRNYAGKMNCQHCISFENAAFRAPWAYSAARDFITRADSAIHGSRIAADLRFTHDTGLMPLLGLIGIDGYDRLYSYDEAALNWDFTFSMCMATNLQAIFYRDRSGSVAVKFLLNEQETSIPVLGPGPYYPWPLVRAHIQNNMKY